MKTLTESLKINESKTDSVYKAVTNALTNCKSGKDVISVFNEIYTAVANIQVEYEMCADDEIDDSADWKGMLKALEHQIQKHKLFD